MLILTRSMKNTLSLLFLILISLPIYSQPKKDKSPSSPHLSASLTGYVEMTQFLEKICRENPYLHYDTLAFSIKGRAIPFISVYKEDSLDKSKLNILLFAQQHGDEPSGKEALLMMLKDIAENKMDEYIEHMNLFIIPMLNPDGAEAGTRRNGRGVDLNRNHLILTEPETHGLHNLFNKYLPEVTLDMHEYYPFDDTTSKFPYIRQFDEQVGILTNLNIDSDILELEKRELLTFINQEVSAKGFLFGEYAVGSIANGKTVRHSTVDIDDGRQSFGIQSTISLISEGLNGKTPTERLEKRRLAQYLVAKSLLQWCMSSPDWIKRRITYQRNQLSKSDDSIVIQMDHFPDGSLRIVPMRNIITNKDSVFQISNFAPKIKSIKKVKRAKGYLVPISDSALVRFLNAHQITYTKANKISTGKVYQYFIVEPIQILLEGMSVWNPTYTYSLVEKDKNLDEYYFIPTAQLKAITITLAFEPNSMFGLANYALYNYLMKKGSYPILRVE